LRGGLNSSFEVVVAKDGWVIYRVYGEDAVPTMVSADPGISREWKEENRQAKEAEVILIVR
jgi:hypothetical protein